MYKKYRWLGASGTLYYGIKKRFLFFWWRPIHTEGMREAEVDAAVKALNLGLSPRGGFGGNPPKPSKPPIKFKW